MNQTTNIQEEWLRVLGKGMVTLPKKWRDEMGFKEGDIIKAKKQGNKVVIESPQNQSAPYRVFTNAEINQFLKEDELPQSLSEKVKKNIASLSS